MIKLAKSILAVVTATLLLGITPVLASDLEWKEADPPAPPDWSLSAWIPLELSIRSNLQYGVDPSTVSIGPDYVVRYVVVAYTPGGTSNAFYEGLRCATGEVKTYARTTVPGQWNLVAKPQWKGLDFNMNANRHTLALARQSLCDNTVVGGRTASDLVRRLKYPVQGP